MRGKYQAYSEYHEPETEWYTGLPSHWSLLRIKHVIESVDSGTSVNAVDSPATEGQIGVLKTSCVYRGAFRPKENKAVVEEELCRVSCPVLSGSLIVSRMNTPELVGAAGLARSSYSNLFLPDRLWQVTFKKAAPEFVHYWTLIDAYRSQVRSVCTGTSSSMQNLSQDQFGNFELPIPHIEEQKVIVSFLDHETAKIDTLIEKQQQLIKLLKEKRQAVISHAVTKGLNPDAPMKDSGVKWLGEVPEHWVVKRLKHISPRVGVGLVINPSTYTTDEGVYFIFGGDVKEYGFDLSKTRRISVKDSDNLLPSRLNPRDLVSIRVGYPGITAVVTDELEGANCASVIVIRRGTFNSDWLCAAMNIWIGRQQVDLASYGAAQKQFNVADAIDFLFPVPPIEEQNEIAIFVEQKLTLFNTLSEKAQQQIELLKERRTALISAAVTGKIDVRNWQPENQPVHVNVS